MYSLKTLTGFELRFRRCPLAPLRQGWFQFFSSFFLLLFKNYDPIPWWDSISRPIAPVSSVAGGDDTKKYAKVMPEKFALPPPKLAQNVNAAQPNFRQI
jgi:hypothetical protein